MSVPPDTRLYKDEDDEIVYEFDWTDFLAGATITTSTFTISGGDGLLTKDNESIAADNLSTSVRLKAGTLRQTYRITNQIVSNASPTETKEKSFLLTIRNE